MSLQCWYINFSSFHLVFLFFIHFFVIWWFFLDKTWDLHHLFCTEHTVRKLNFSFLIFLFEFPRKDSLRTSFIWLVKPWKMVDIMSTLDFFFILISSLKQKYLLNSDLQKWDQTWENIVLCWIKLFIYACVQNCSVISVFQGYFSS